MGRLIDVNDVIKAIDKHTFDTDDGLCLDDDITCILEEVPTIEERLTGWWIPQDHNKTNGMVSTVVYYYPKCSVCGHCANYTNFCPNCGARMVQEGEDNGTAD